MLKIGIFSDSHGNKRGADRLLELLSDCAYVIFLGDGLRDIELYQDVRLIKVCGNCDWFADEPGRRIKTFEQVQTYITHGADERVKQGLEYLAQSAKARGCTLALYGHTHTARTDTVSGVLCVNPGALADGRYAVAELDGDRVSVRLMRL